MKTSKDLDRSGTVGDVGADGWVTWTTRDDGASYNPALHCGVFEITVARGESWGAAKDGGVLFVSVYSSAPADDDDSEEVGDQVILDLKFSWCQAAFVDAVVEAMDELEDYEDIDHPAPHNVIDAARELWTALMLKDAGVAP